MLSMQQCRNKNNQKKENYRERRSDVFYSLLFTKEKSIQHWIKQSFFISKTLHTFVWSFQSKNLTYVTSHSFFSARSGQSRQVRSATWKSFNKNKSLYLCNFYLVVLKLMSAKMAVQGPFICYFYVSTPRTNLLLLKELRNCILCIISVWSLFCSARVYKSLHFLPVLLVKLSFRLSMF